MNLFVESRVHTAGTDREGLQARFCFAQLLQCLFGLAFYFCPIAGGEAGGCCCSLSWVGVRNLSVGKMGMTDLIRRQT